MGDKAPPTRRKKSQKADAAGLQADARQRVPISRHRLLAAKGIKAGQVIPRRFPVSNGRPRVRAAFHMGLSRIRRRRAAIAPTFSSPRALMDGDTMWRGCHPHQDRVRPRARPPSFQDCCAPRCGVCMGQRPARWRPPFHPVRGQQSYCAQLGIKRASIVHLAS